MEKNTRASRAGWSLLLAILVIAAIFLALFFLQFIVIGLFLALFIIIILAIAAVVVITVMMVPMYVMKDTVVTEGSYEMDQIKPVEGEKK